MLFRCLALLLLVFIPPFPALAVDGVVEINQARGLAGGVTPGDDPGLPVTISQAGSYRLTSPMGTSQFGTVIEIDSDNVSLDLNGFTVRCTPIGIFTQCTSGIGIDAVGHNNVRIANGTVEGFGSDGISTGGRARIENVHANDNGRDGIRVGNGSIVHQSSMALNGGDGLRAAIGSVVSHSTAYENEEDGIVATGGSTVTHCSAFDNGGDGIAAGPGSTVSNNSAYSNHGDGMDLGIVSGASTVAGGLAIGNTAVLNDGVGIRMEPRWGFRENVMNQNNGGNANDQTAGGFNLGNNLCGLNNTCP